MKFKLCKILMFKENLTRYFACAFLCVYLTIAIYGSLKRPFDTNVNIKRLIRGPLSSFDPQLIEEVAKNYLIPPSSGKYNLKLNKTDSESQKYNAYRSTLWVWKYLDEEARVLFPPRYKKKGFYVEVGAFDGEYLSNSLFLDIEYGWNGLLIEPDEGLFQSLQKKNRKAWSCHCCLSSKPYPHETVLTKIDTTDGNTVALNKRIYNSIKESRSNNLRDNFGVPIYETVQCIPLHTLLLALNQTHVDLIYLDVEDVEVDLLKNFAFDKIFVDIWIVEHRNPKSDFQNWTTDPDFIAWFESQGYVLYKIAPYKLDYIFIRKESNYYRLNQERLKLPANT